MARDEKNMKVLLDTTFCPGKKVKLNSIFKIMHSDQKFERIWGFCI